MTNPPIIVDPEFAALIPPLTRDEDQALTTSIRREGCRDPLAVWRTPEGDVLIDGHNRYRICAFDNLPYRITVVPGIASRDDAVTWMLDTQLARRNLTPEQASYLRGQRYNRSKLAPWRPTNKQAKSAHLSVAVEVEEVPQNEGVTATTAARAEETAERLAAELKVSPRTIKNDGKFAAAVDTLGQTAGTEVKRTILAGDSPLPKRDVVALAAAPPADQQAVLAYQSEEEMLAAAREVRERQAAERRQARANVALVNGNINDEEKAGRELHARWKHESEIGRTLERLFRLTSTAPEEAAALTVQSGLAALFVGNTKDMADAGQQWLRQYSDHLARHLGIPDNVRRLP